jgi:hypothetical protein
MRDINSNINLRKDILKKSINKKKLENNNNNNRSVVI